MYAASVQALDEAYRSEASVRSASSEA